MQAQHQLTSVRETVLRFLVLVLALSVVASACTDDGHQARVASQGRTSPSYPLPLGLEPVDGTEAIGRPLVFDHVGSVFDGEPVEAEAVRAAYRVTGDPESVLRAWAEQLVPLGVGDVLLRLTEPPSSPAPWGEIGTSPSAWEPNAPPPGFVDVQLWATETDPILLVSIDRHHGVERVPSSFIDDGGELESAPREVGGTLPDPGDELFTEQGSVMHLPEGARALMPSIPTSRGTGGSTSVLAAADEVAVIRRMLDEAVAQNEYHEVSPPVVEEQERITVTTARFVVPAGGWDFQVVAVRTPDEREAVLWVQSAAD